MSEDPWVRYGPHVRSRHRQRAYGRARAELARRHDAEFREILGIEQEEAERAAEAEYLDYLDRFQRGAVR